MIRAAAAAFALALAGCATAGPTEAVRSTGGEVRAVVQSVDMTNREVLLRFEDGAVESFTAGPEVRNLAQLEAGDTVVALVEEIVSLRLARPEDVPAAAVAAERAPAGERPGFAAISGISTVVTVVGYDAETHLATFTTPAGETLTREVAPEMREFAAARQPGDRVFVEVFDLVAVGVEEVAP
ncbi:MAG: hypothetical protein ACFCUS_05930 [Rubrimonas sp.]|uniref:hypothetical protein n=1 Tax=Rubrimonas sp. TaxID=2036015 RepID=UPI002FDCBB68